MYLSQKVTAAAMGKKFNLMKSFLPSNVATQKWVEDDRVEICKVFPRRRFLSSFTILIGFPVKNRRTLHKWRVRENKLFVSFLLFDKRHSAMKTHIHPI